MKGIGQIAGGFNAYNAGKYTRSVMTTNAQNAENAGVSERDRIRAQADMAMGRQATAAGASGFQPGTGSALDLLKQSATNRELDLITSRARATAQATDFSQKGQFAYQQGKGAEAGGILSGAMSIADSVAGAFGGAAAGDGAGAGGDASVGFGGGSGWDGPAPDLSSPMALTIGARAPSTIGGY